MVSKRILLLTPFFPPNIGGVESHLDNLCQYLRQKGYYLYVLTFQPLTTPIMAPAFEQFENMEVRRLLWPGFNLFHKLEPYPVVEFLYLAPYLFLQSFFFLIKHRQEIDVIHAHGLIAAFAGRLLLKFFHRRAVVSTYAIYNFNPTSIYAKITAWTLSAFDEIQPLADPSKEELLSLGLDARKMKVYYLWLNPGEFKLIDRQEAKKSLGLSDKFIVLSVSRLIPIKGSRLILEVAKELSQVTFVFIGDGPLASELERASRSYRNVSFIGRISRAEKSRLNQYYCAADIFVIPSLYEEAFGKVVIEALYCGTPVIGSNRGALPGIIQDQVGLVVEPTVENFKEKISYLLGNPEKLRSLSDKCHNYAQEKFTVKNAEVIERGYFD